MVGSNCLRSLWELPFMLATMGSAVLILNWILPEALHFSLAASLAWQVAFHIASQSAGALRMWRASPVGRRSCGLSSATVVCASLFLPLASFQCSVPLGRGRGHRQNCSYGS